MLRVPALVLDDLAARLRRRGSGALAQLTARELRTLGFARDTTMANSALIPG